MMWRAGLDAAKDSAHFTFDLGTESAQFYDVSRPAPFLESANRKIDESLATLQSIYLAFPGVT